MKMKKTILVTMLLAAVLLSCKDGDKDEHTHEWEWVVTTPATTEADGLETETCKTCGAESGETRIIEKLVLETKTFPITFQDRALVFTVEYKAYPTDAEPAYLTYLQTRLALIVNGTSDTAVDATAFLMSKGNSFKITIEYAEPTYNGMSWDTTLQSFKIHNNWISTATSGNLSVGMIADAFDEVVTQ